MTKEVLTDKRMIIAHMADTTPNMQIWVMLTSVYMSVTQKSSHANDTGSGKTK